MGKTNSPYCRNIVGFGYCHDPECVKDQRLPPLFKEMLCPDFEEGCSCHYAKRCHSAHGVLQLRHAMKPFCYSFVIEGHTFQIKALSIDTAKAAVLIIIQQTGMSRNVYEAVKESLPKTFLNENWRVGDVVIDGGQRTPFERLAPKMLHTRIVAWDNIQNCWPEPVVVSDAERYSENKKRALKTRIAKTAKRYQQCL